MPPMCACSNSASQATTPWPKTTALLAWDGRGAVQLQEASLGEAALLLAAIIHAAALEPAKTRAWTIVRAVDYWLWGLDHGFTEDPVRCHRLFDALTASYRAA